MPIHEYRQLGFMKFHDIQNIVSLHYDLGIFKEGSLKGPIRQHIEKQIPLRYKKTILLRNLFKFQRVENLMDSDERPEYE